MIRPFFALSFLLSLGLGAAEETPIQDHAALVKARKGEWWNKMDYGPFITGVLHVQSTKTDALKSINVEMGGDAAPMTFAFDTDLLRGACVFQGRTKRNGTPYNGAHGGTMETSGDELLGTSDLPGWSKGGSFKDPRPIKSGRIPSDWAKYKGLVRHGEDITFQYTVGSTSVADHPSTKDGAVFRDLNVGERSEDLYLALMDGKELPAIAEGGLSASGKSANGQNLVLGLTSDCGAKFVLHEGRLCVLFPKGDKAAKARIGISRSTMAALSQLASPQDLTNLLTPGQGLYPQILTVKGEIAANHSAYVVDDIPVPFDNPWESKMRIGAFDFFADGSTAAVCTWNGDVWIVSGIDDKFDKITWKRYATGLYETLGLKIEGDKVIVHGRDQLTRLHDDNADGEADRYECFNNDVMTTRNFHEFAFDLKTDPEGNFYFSKGGPVKGGGKGFDTIVPHNGTIMKVSKDGSKMEVVGTGLRAPNGIGVGPKGEITAGENEGTAVPTGRIQWFKAGKFASVPDTAQGEKSDKLTPPLCWIPMSMDNSNGDQCWVPDDRWGPFSGDMLHLSYGTCFLMKVMRQDLPDNQVQGGVYRIGVNLASGSMRSRFNAKDGQLYVTGLQGWQTTAARLTAFQRVRYTGQPVRMPKELKFTDKGAYVTWTCPLDKASAEKAGNYSVSRWNYVWGKAYGSGEFSVDNPETELMKKAYTEQSKGYSNRDRVWVRSATLLADGKTVFLDIPNMKVCHQMSLASSISAASGEALEYEIYGTVNQMPSDPAAITHPEIAKPEPFKKDLAAGLKVTVESPAGKDVFTTPNAAWEVREDEAHSAFLGPYRGATKTTLRGFIRIKDPITAVFNSPHSGQMTVRVDGTPVLQFLQTLSTQGRAVKLEPGDHELVIEIESRGDGGSGFRLLWSSDKFPQEAIPAEILFHEPDVALAKSAQLRRGRELVADLACSKCHGNGVEAGKGMPELDLALPDLKDAGARFNRDWLAHWILNPHKLRHDTAMPALVKNEKDALDIASYLASQGSPAAATNGDAKLGGESFHNLGCIACHSLPSSATAAAGRIPLHRVAQKFTAAGLVSFLKNPKAHNSDIRMPDFKLSEVESANLAAWLLGSSLEKSAAVDAGDVARGKELYATVGCAQCHDGAAPKATALAKLSGKDKCSTADYSLKAEDAAALKTFLAEGVKSLANQDRREAGLRLVEKMQCAACHAHNGTQERLAGFHGETKHLLTHEQHLVDQSRPPMSLFAEKLDEKYFAAALKGERKKSERPWLLMRMPAFPKAQADLAVFAMRRTAGAGFLGKEPKFDEAKAAKGAEIAKTYACAICHSVGSAKPTAAFECEGVNLAHTSERMNYEHYVRWMKTPQRYWNGTKMPPYGLNDDQLTDLWHWLEKTKKDNKK
jgi:mono/diheme cytochrome c family protein